MGAQVSVDQGEGRAARSRRVLRVGEGAGHAEADVEDDGDRDRLGRGEQVQVGGAHAVHQLQGDVGHAVVQPGVELTDDVRVVEQGADAGLLVEHAQQLRVAGLAGADALHHAGLLLTVGPTPGREVDLGHAALADAAEDAEGAPGLTDDAGSRRPTPGRGRRSDRDIGQRARRVRVEVDGRLLEGRRRVRGLDRHAVGRVGRVGHGPGEPVERAERIVRFHLRALRLLVEGIDADVL